MAFGNKEFYCTNCGAAQWVDPNSVDRNKSGGRSVYSGMTTEEMECTSCNGTYLFTPSQRDASKTADNFDPSKPRKGKGRKKKKSKGLFGF